MLPPTTEIEALATFVLERFALVTNQAGEKFATAISPNGFKQYTLTSIAFRDVVRRHIEDRGELFDDAIFETLIRRWLEMPFETLPVCPQSRSVRRAIDALRAVADDARRGRITVGELWNLGAEFRAVTEAMS